ncbi:hypothetical protein BJY01DRAFT_246111 [Aspergillus pseudoustus]|uniref:Uncharacterized protein n=1 Tax=Aspergillus pseudoustus TaxID=1810923 RepID=A0ABR4K9C8_9EURO
MLGGDGRADCSFESSFYPHCIVVAGGIPSPWPADKATNPPNTAHYARRSIMMLEQLEGSWQHATRMLARLSKFISVAHEYSTLLEPAWLAMELCQVEREQLWTMIDYGMACTSTWGDLSTDASWTVSSDPLSWSLSDLC